jgi:hypothetical protein
MPADVRWYGVRLTTGAVVEELPIEVSGSLSQRLGAYSSASATLGIPAAPAGWEGACEPRQTMLVCALDDVIVWGGRVVAREGGTGPTVSLGLATLESYLDWRYVGDHLWEGGDEASVIAAGLAADANAVEGIGLVIDAPATGTNRDRTYKDQDDKTVYSALRELMGVEGGPEWTVELAWSSADRVAVTKTLKVRDRIGVSLEQPGAVFSTHGEASASYTLSEDHSSGKAGNHVVATSSGEGDTRPQSSPARDEALLDLEPRYEHRFTPSTSITNISTLNAHARQELARVSPGGRVVKITSRFDAYPRLGVDWLAGDDIRYELEGHRHPDGFTGVGRCIGWELDLGAGTVSPMLLVPGEEVV